MGNARMLKSVNQLSELTGRDRRTVKKQLEELHFVLGEKSAHLYESSEALPLIYRVDNLESARAKQALSQASLNAIKEENLRKERVPLQLALDEMDSLFQAMGAILKNTKELSPSRINEIFDKFRAIPARLKS